MILGREPSLFYALVAQVIALFSALVLPLTVDQQGALNGVVFFASGCVLAWKVAAEKGIALLGGVAKAVIAVGLAFGWHFSPENQSTLMLFVSTVIAFILRSQVVAPEPVPVPPVAGDHDPFAGPISGLEA